MAPTSRGELGGRRDRESSRVRPTTDRAAEMPQQNTSQTTADMDNPLKKAGKESKLGKIWKKTDLDLTTVLTMIKAALPPTISLAIYQSTPVAETYTTLGYLIAVVSIFSFCIMPRAKFIRNMLVNVAVTCLAAAAALLMNWTSVQARIHTTPSGSPLLRYNASQSAVCGVWLFFNIYLVGTLKAKFPQFVFSAILYAIFINVSATFGPQFHTMAQVEAFTRRLLITFLTGFGIATPISLLVFPSTSRKIVHREITSYIGALRKYLQAHKNYIHSLETKDMFKISLPDGENEASAESPEVKALKALTITVTELYGKLSGDLPLAKREIAYGHLGPQDLSEITKLLRAVMVPSVGLSALVDIFGRFAEVNRKNSEFLNHEDPHFEAHRRRLVSDWNAISKMVHEPFAALFQTMDEGLEHVLLKLRLQKPPKDKKLGPPRDVEAQGASIRPGDPGFSDYLSRQVDIFHDGREMTLRQWCAHKGVKVSEDFFTSYHDSERDNPLQRMVTIDRWPLQRQLNLLLYMEYLLYSIGRAILDFARYADQLEAQGTFSKPRLILPGKKRIKKWLLQTFRTEDAADDDLGNGIDGSNAVIWLGEAFRSRKDPEHLPPQSKWEHAGNLLRRIAGFLRTPESAFGFRCACATMSLAVIAFLRDSQDLFIQERLLWALIMISISMTPTSGQSIYGLVLRLAGTVIAMLAAFCVWYIPNGNTVGALVLFFIALTCGFYIPIKQPKYIIIGIISVITVTLIVGYELEVQAIGRERAESNGQPYHPTYLLGPYRLANVAAGLSVAFIWTFFPYPINEHSALRQSLGAALYLSANYYSIVHQTMLARIRGDEGDAADKTSPGHRLTKARNKVFAKHMVLSQALRTYSNFVRWEIPIGGKFPKTEYDIIINCVTNIVRYTSLIAYASQTYTTTNSSESKRQWFHDFRKIVAAANVTSHEITSLLALLSSSIKNGQPLPPYLKPPPPFQLSRDLEAQDSDILSVRHIAEAGYAAFAVIQISTRCIHGDIEKVLSTVKKLVGELDFSFHVVSTGDGSESERGEREDAVLFAVGEGRRKVD